MSFYKREIGSNIALPILCHLSRNRYVPGTGACIKLNNGKTVVSTKNGALFAPPTIAIKEHTWRALRTFSVSRDEGNSVKMGNRRFTQVSTSDEDDDLPPPSSRTRKSEENQQQSRQSKRKRIKLQEEEDEEQEEEKRKASRRERKRKGKEKEEEKPRDDNVEEEEQEEDQPQEDAKPVGEPVRLSGKGRGRRSHYEAFEFDGNRYELVSTFFHLNYRLFIMNLTGFGHW